MIVCSTLPPACKRLTRFWFNARERDAVAREELFQRYRDDAYRVAYRLLGHEQDALDVVQEALIKAFLDWEILTVEWISVLALADCRQHGPDWGRRRKRRTILSIGNGRSDLPEPAFHDDPARRLHQQELRRTLDKALDRPQPQDPHDLRSIRRAGFELQRDRGNARNSDRHGHEPHQRRARSCSKTWIGKS